MTNDTQPKPKRKTLRWRREPREKGLAAVCQGERGWELWYGDERVATVAVAYTGFGPGRSEAGYYWYGGSETHGVPRRNTASEPVATADQAKAECRAYVERHLKRGNQSKGEHREQNEADDPVAGR